MTENRQKSSKTMKNQPRQPEQPPEDLQALLDQLGYAPAAREDLRDTLHVADQAWADADDNAMPASDVLARVQQKVHAAILARRRAVAWRRSLVPLAAAAAVALLASVSLWLHMHEAPGPQTPDTISVVATAQEPTRELVEFWELALVRPEETRREVDSLLINETLTLWKQNNWDVQTVFGKETEDEDFNTGMDDRRGDLVLLG